MLLQLVCKSLGCFCLRSSKEQEIANQLRAYKATLLTSLEQMQAAAAALQQLQHDMQLFQMRHNHHTQRAQYLRQELQHERDFAGHTQRCELYVAFLGDLLLCHPSMLRREMAKQQLQQQQQLEEQQEQQQGGEATATAAGECLLDLLWKVVTATEAATKRLQSFALRVLMKLLLLGLVLQQQQQRHQQLHQEQQQQEQQQQEHQQAILAARLEVLLEALYLQPVLQHQYREHEKYVRS